MTAVSDAQVGDVIVESGGQVGRTVRTGEVIEVLDEHGHLQLRVRWEDGHESIYIPGSDATIRRPGSKHATTTS